MSWISSRIEETSWGGGTTSCYSQIVWRGGIVNYAAVASDLSVTTSRRQIPHLDYGHDEIPPESSPIFAIFLHQISAGLVTAAVQFLIRMEQTHLQRQLPIVHRVEHIRGRIKRSRVVASEAGVSRAYCFQSVGKVGVDVFVVVNSGPESAAPCEADGVGAGEDNQVF